MRSSRQTSRGLPLTAAWIDPTRVVVTTTDGVWDWLPGSPARLVARLPASVVVSVDAGEVRLDPIPMREGRYVPRPLDEGWTLDLATHTVRRRTLGPARQAWGQDRYAGVVATAHPEAHVVALSSVERYDVDGLAVPPWRGVDRPHAGRLGRRRAGRPCAWCLGGRHGRPA